MIKYLKSYLYDKYQTFKFKKIINKYDKNNNFVSVQNDEINKLKKNGFLILEDYIKDIDKDIGNIKNWKQFGKSLKKIKNVLITRNSIVYKILTDEKINNIIKNYLGSDGVLDYVEFQKIEINSSYKSISENWHYDNVGKRIKIFIYLNNCEKIFTKYLAETNQIFHEDYSIKGSRIKKKLIKRFIDKEVSLIPKKGNISIIDTNGYHRGVFSDKINSVNEKREMIVLEFSSKNKSSELSKISNDIGPRFVFFDKDIDFSKMLINKHFLTEFQNFYYYDQNYVNSF